MKTEGSWNRNSEFLIKNLPYKQENPKDLNKPWKWGILEQNPKDYLYPNNA